MAYGVGLSQIGDAEIANAAAMGDLDKACLHLQSIAQIEGSIAALVFAGFDWGSASQEERKSKLRKWLAVEASYIDDQKETDAGF